MAQQDQLRLLLADDIAATRENVKKLLSFERDITVVGMAENGQQAVEMARETQPHIILMDINMPGIDGIEAVTIICQEMPGVHVIMMSVQKDRPYMRRALQAGARAYLTKPFTYDELSNVLDQVRKLQPRPAAMPALRAPVAIGAAPTKLASLVAVFSPRGGAGCSTVALNVAFILRGQRKQSVLLVDGNLRFGALDAMLNLEASRSITDTLAALDDDDPEVIHNATLPHTSGLRLLAAPPSPEMADLVTAQHLEKIIALGRRRYDYVVADLGSNLSDNTLLFMDTATRIIVVLTPDIPAVKNVRLFLEIAQGLDYDPQKIILALNQTDSQEAINAPAIERHLKHPVSVSIPSYPRTVRTAINRGIPLALYEREVNKEMPITRQLLTLTDMIPQPEIERATPAPGVAFRPAPTTKKKSRFGGLFKRGN